MLSIDIKNEQEQIYGDLYGTNVFSDEYTIAFCK